MISKYSVQVSVLAIPVSTWQKLRMKHSQRGLTCTRQPRLGRIATAS